MKVPHSELSRWSADDVDLMLAYRGWRDGIGPHGFPLDEATNPDANPLSASGTYRYVADPPIIDWVEKARLDAEEAWRKGKPDDVKMHGMIFRVRREERTESNGVDPFSFEGQ